MEPILFTIILLLFYIPAVIYLFVGLIFYRKKLFRKTVKIWGLVCLCILWLLVGTIKIKDNFTTNHFHGIYLGEDSYKNLVTVKINNDESFKIMVDNCNEPNITGTYQYVSDYEAFLFYGNDCDVSIHENYKQELLLNCKKDNSCYNLVDVKLSKIK
jgi:hypothetical protein